MADQSPAVGLPEAEFVEIYNRGENPVDLAGWTIADDGDPTPLDSQILLPGQFLILCASSHAYRFVSFGQVLGVANFPSLNNTGDSFVLKNHDGVMIDSVHYDLSWYNDDEEEKQDGGWTLELIYPENTCAEKENWMASMDFAGGTPGRQNSVYTEKPDLTAPTLISAVAQNASELLVTFSEKLEASVPIFDRFSLNPVLSIAGIEFANQTLTAFRIRLSEDLTGGVLYTLTVNEIFDCPGNAIDADANSVTFALPQVAESMDILVNEILFNPTSTGVDFIEVYNASDKYINLKDWKLASRDDEEIVNHKVISSVDLLIAPHAFLVFTEDSNVLKGEYAKGQEENFFETDIPSLPDDKGSVVLIDPEGNTIDYVTYRDNYHSIFIQEDEGVSLERLNVTTVSLDPDNWKSASTSVQATPGYLNSNAIGETSPGDNSIQVSPEVFLPSVGQPSFTTISYKFEKPGYVGSVRIIDSRGNEIKTIASNELLSAEGFFRWDGDRDDGSKARVGSYMIYVEVFDDKGAMNTFRKRVVVATKF